MGIETGRNIYKTPRFGFHDGLDQDSLGKNCGEVMIGISRRTTQTSKQKDNISYIVDGG